VDDGDGAAADLDLQRLRQPPAQLGVVDVAVDGVDDGTERFEVGEVIAGSVIERRRCPQPRPFSSAAL
jgi:hypothetical protein